MNKNPILSIIVPVYKVEPYLEKCIKSIIGQDFEDFELILVDDGSPDRCGAVCDDYALKDNRIKVIHKKNGGLSSARNTGIEAAKGSFLSFIDSDDYVSSDFYEANIKYLQNHPEVDMVVIPISLEEDNTGKQRPFKAHLKPCMKEGKESIVDFLWSRHFLLLQSAIYKASIWEEIRFPLGMLHEDSYILPDLAETVNRIGISSIGVHYYLKREGSITAAKSAKKSRDMMSVAFRNLDYLKQFPNTYIYNHRLLGFTHTLRTIKSTIPTGEYEEYITRIKSYPLNRKTVLFSHRAGYKEKLFALLYEFLLK
ncbi:glycosyltransferase family 2 protein [Porphyromonas gulae]|uniref:glycosyltransferase family 2 protein n=1 Tax=Porphyromonas gulae TaxID=111105 RepID=UPI00068F84B2|nr:glycosyltransferase family A protein [Porphyromonas gulae]